MSCPLTYIRPHPRSFEVAGVCEKPLALRRSPPSESARLALVRVRVQGVVVLCAGS
jgi:hypothetical protein